MMAPHSRCEPDARTPMDRCRGRQSPLPKLSDSALTECLVLVSPSHGENRGSSPLGSAQV
jgi:hypothetical protein